MGEQVSSVTVVGGGDSGMLTALAIRQLHPDMTIRVVDDFSEDPPNVGKSTFYAIMTLFHDFLEIDETQFYHEVKPVWKGSVFFRDWCGYDPFHFAFDARSKKPNPASSRSGQSLYYHYKTQSLRTVAEEIVDQQKTPILFSPSDGSYAQYPYMAYHLPLRRFSAFLEALCGERDVDLVDDRVTDVTVGSNGQTIRRVSSDTQVYQSDLYIDCTGFRRLLISELDAEYKHFDIPLDAAVHATADHTLGDIEPATIVETGEYGWFWQIDTHDNRDLGYVYSSAHLDQDAAVAELDAHRDEEFTTVEHYAFDSGFYEDAWVGNCIANGNAVGFIEPLQSTALTTHLKVAMRLSRMLASHARYNTPALREGFNKYVRASWNSIYDFISVYGTKHMVALADRAMIGRLPVVLVVPLGLPFSIREKSHEMEDGSPFEGALVIGLGDAVMPGILVASAAVYGPVAPTVSYGVAVSGPILGTIAGTLVGLTALFAVTSRGGVHPGLPLLVTGALVGYFLGGMLVGVPPLEAVGMA